MKSRYKGSKIKIQSIIMYSLLLLFFLGALYFYNRPDKVYAQIGSWYYKHNEISKAQTFYEKSFLHGNKDTVIRNTYVNSIINSPLTIESQEKLARLAGDNIQDSASIKAKTFLEDLKREIYKKYPENYIKQCPYNHKIIRWGHFPITYSYKNTSGVPENYIEEINNAFSAWEKVGVVLFTRVSDEADIVINFQNNQNRKMEYGRKYVVAYTVPIVSNLTLERMDINFFIQNPEGSKFTSNQIYNTALHEIFHALGFMGHSFNPDNIMYLAKDNNTLINDSRASLSEADINTLKLLYKIKPDITNEIEQEGEYISYLILGDDEEVNRSKFKEAKNYIYHAPTLPSGYIDLAESLVAEERYSEAIRSLEKALNLSDTDEMRYIVYYNLAVAYHYIGNTSMALEYLESASKIKDCEELHFLKAEVLLPQDKSLAEKEYRYLIQNSPDNEDYVIRLANLYIKDKKYLKARSVLKSYIKRNPKQRRSERFIPYRILLF